MWRRVRWLVLWSLWATRLVRQPAPLVRLRQGALRGQLAPDGSHYQYLGIPYATSQYQYRFQAPGPAPAWEGVFEAVEEHIRCPQRFWALVLGREDCLVLNVYRPAHARTASPLPVMVFIHGGGFREGSGSRLLYGPDHLVAHDVVLVTFNYRLGVQGFLCLGIKEAPGNAGMKDQVAALEWVRRNIRAFGGDSENVTIFGESAGAASVSYHLVSPSSAGLFHKAIMQSGSSTAPWARQADPLGVATALAKAVGHDSDDPKRLYNIFMNESLPNLITADVPRKEGQLKFLHLPYVPCTEPRIEGVQPFITDTSFNIFTSGNFNKVPVIIGFNDQEGYFFASFEDDESLRSMKFEESLPSDLDFPSASERRLAAQQMKQLYLGDDEVSRGTLLRLSRLHGEPYFTVPALVETELLLRAGARPVYTYLFEYDGWRNFPKLISGLTYWLAEGASHADDLFYLFRLFPVPTLFETAMIDTMTTLWTNFAKYGEPGSAAGVQWPAAARGSPAALRLGARPHLAPLADHRPQHVQFWRALYDKYRLRVNVTAPTPAG